MDDILLLDEDFEDYSGAECTVSAYPIHDGLKAAPTADAMLDYDDLIAFGDDDIPVTPTDDSQDALNEKEWNGSRASSNLRVRHSARAKSELGSEHQPLSSSTESTVDNDERTEREDEGKDAVEGEEPGEDEAEEDDEEEDDEGRRDSAISRIEGLVTNFLEQLATLSTVEEDEDPVREGKKIEIKLARRRASDTERDDSQGTRSLKWPNRRAKGASGLPLARLMGVLNVAHESLVTDLPTTKRDMFYQDVGLFGHQREVDQLTDDLAATFQLDRSDLNIRASGKGLLCGDGLRIVLADESSISATNTDPVLIPQAEDILRFELNHEIAWVLVVEKEAVFQTLCRLNVTNLCAFPGPGIVITGKGYPDVATRQLVATLSNNLPESVPILAMVDGDAYGLDIASVYKFGSGSMRHEAHKLVAERIECIGLFASELQAFGVNGDAMLPTNKADEKKARSMLKRTNLPDRWRVELENMLATHRKAEIEILSSTTGAEVDLDSADTQWSQKRVHPLVRYLSEKIHGCIVAMGETHAKMEED
ncbi:unnamed protein product [Peniophora sp. CBMAI 1063]|nr:unnamed protein product [Peniophora sp. CBMAI 1063]